MASVRGSKRESAARLLKTVAAVSLAATAAGSAAGCADHPVASGPREVSDTLCFKAAEPGGAGGGGGSGSDGGGTSCPPQHNFGVFNETRVPLVCEPCYGKFVTVDEGIRNGEECCYHYVASCEVGRCSEWE